MVALCLELFGVHTTHLVLCVRLASVGLTQSVSLLLVSSQSQIMSVVGSTGFFKVL